MSVKTLTVTDVARHFSDYVNRVAYRNERFILRKGRHIMAELRPITAGRSLGELPDIINSLPRLSERESSGFAKDLLRNRKKTARERLRDPWAF